MGGLLNVDEVFEMAEQFERNGAKFYRAAAAQTVGAEANELLQRLAAMEDVHEMIFHALRKSLVGDAMFQTLQDPEQEAVRYLRAWVDRHVFRADKDPGKTIERGTPLALILDTAINMEKESIAFYVGVKEMVPVERGRIKIDKIIQEEMAHITTLIEELMKLEKS
jgi:rubrerythrin